MRKYVEMPIEVLERLVDGKCVEGSVRRDVWTGKIIFRAYNRQPKVRNKDKLIRKLPWGWVKKSTQRLKVYGSFPEELGTARVLNLIDEHTREAKNALIENELIEFC